ncbi:hypothetical protein [Methylomicrobium lacus]|uniref:hypothetical protein n=1 Tax=Methylomicrobium lacus TaxID=136992 RepID=UPI0035A905B8
MGTILKSALLTLLVMIMKTPPATADTVQYEERLVLFATADKALPEELDNARGREGVDMTLLNIQDLQATINGNANHNVNGFNMIDNNSFTHVSGIASVIQNSGNNVIIQDSTIVSVTVNP